MNYSALAKSYSTLTYTINLKGLLNAFFETEKFSNYNKRELIITINDTLFQNYEGEQVLKYKLAKEFVKKKYIAAFEVRAKKSRTDFLVINGDTKSFEIKSKIDNLQRLSKQVLDYGDVFEFNTVVIDLKHLENVSSMIPHYYGIWSFEGSKKVVIKEATKSPNLCAQSQLELLNKKELIKYFFTHDISIIIENFSKEEINLTLKKALKQRYQLRWNFVQSNWDKIIPIDIQFFFNTNVCPNIIYG